MASFNFGISSPRLDVFEDAAGFETLDVAPICASARAVMVRPIEYAQYLRHA